MINIICMGKIKEKYLNDFINDYLNRIQKYHKINIIELKDTNDIELEGVEILRRISNRDYVIVCDIKGSKVNSLEFSKVIDTAFLQSGVINFVIGSSCGLSSVVKQRANKMISFSDLTFPHGVFRGILLEQIYRSFKIINNETYHK